MFDEFEENDNLYICPDCSNGYDGERCSHCGFNIESEYDPCFFMLAG